MTEQELDALKALADAATPGPWARDAHYVFRDVNEATGVLAATQSNAAGNADAAFIAASRAAVSALIAEVERLREELEDYADAIAHEQRRRER